MRKKNSQAHIPRVLVVGLGNLLLKDDGVGVHAVRELLRTPRAGVRIVEVGTAVLDALHLYEWSDMIIALDAMQAGGSPGTIYKFGVEEVKRPVRQASLHEVTLVSVLEFIKSGTRPQIAILGVEPETIDYGLSLSPAVQSALPKLVQAVWSIVEEWRPSPRNLQPPSAVAFIQPRATPLGGGPEAV